jgi:hypothetical protein
VLSPSCCFLLSFDVGCGAFDAVFRYVMIMKFDQVGSLGKRKKLHLQLQKKYASCVADLNPWRLIAMLNLRYLFFQ